MLMPAEHKCPGRRSLLVLSLTLAAGLLVAGRVLAQDTEEAPQAEAQPARYWYCEECGLEMPCPRGSEEKPMRCPHCIHKGVVMGVYDYSHKDGGPSASRSWDGLWLKILIGVAVVLVLSERIITRWQRGRRARTRSTRPAAQGREDVSKWLEETDRIRPRRRRKP
jgi:hypothetical protein